MFLVCGEALFDVFVGEETGRGALALEAHAGGSPFNVAIGLARLGQPAALLTGMSDDPLGQRLVERLRSEGVATRYLVASGRRTTLSLVGLDRTGVPSYMFYGVGSADCSLTEADMPALRAEITGLHFGSYSIAVSPVADAFAALARRERHRFISLDPNLRPTVEPDIAAWQARIAALLPHTSLVKVSEEDLALLAPDEAAEAIARRWLGTADEGPALVVVTRGSAGVIAFTRTLSVERPAIPVAVVDTVGAGDSFQAALIDGLWRRDALARAALAGLDATGLEAVLDRAVHAAAITCARRGADLPTRQTLEAAR